MGMMKRLVVLVLVGYAAAAIGCAGGPRMGRYDVVVSMDPALVNEPGGAPSVTVNLVGVNDAEAEKWNAKNMNEYWTPNDPLRQDAASYAHVMQFGPGRSEPKTLSKDDPIWNTWSNSGAMHLFVLADLPGSHEARPGSADARRLVLPLDRRRWEAGKPIEIELQRSTIRLKTQMKPEPKK